MQKFRWMLIMSFNKNIDFITFDLDIIEYSEEKPKPNSKSYISYLKNLIKVPKMLFLWETIQLLTLRVYYRTTC